MSANVPRCRDLEQQLAHLRWRRWQNERSIRNCLEVGNSMREKDTILNMSIDKAGERAMWMTSVVRDELQRPLVLADEEMNFFQDQHSKSKDRLRRNAERQHITLKSLRDNLENRTVSGEKGKRDIARKVRKLNNIERRIVDKKKTIESRQPLVHAKWSGHDELIRSQQRIQKSISSS